LLIFFRFGFLETTEADGEAILRMNRVCMGNYSLILDRSETTKRSSSSSMSGRNHILNPPQPRLDGSGDFSRQMSENSGRSSSSSSHSSDQKVASCSPGHGSLPREASCGTVYFEFADAKANDSASVHHSAATSFKSASMPGVY
jgi:hypothetical protein